MTKHEIATCRLCQEVPAELPRRHWKHEAKAGYWHIVCDGPNLLARLPRAAHFITVLAYRPGRDSSPTHYTGPMYCEFDASHSADALNDLRRCLQILEVEVGCPLEAMHVWHSGGRGYHVTIPALVIGAEAGHPSLPWIYKAMITRLFPSQIAPTLDRTVYSGGMGRMWRLVNRRRSENGRFKIPLAPREVLHTTYAELEALTHRPRKGVFWPPDDELSPCPSLVELYRETIASLKGLRPAQAAPTVESRIREGRRNAALASLAGTMRRRGASQEAITAALQAENQRRCDPPLADGEVAGIAASIARYQPAISPTASKSARTLGQWRGIRTLPTAEVSLWPR
jgi:Primase C terminal 1 (PriCT-1)